MRGLLFVQGIFVFNLLLDYLNKYLIKIMSDIKNILSFNNLIICKKEINLLLAFFLFYKKFFHS